MLFFKKNIYDPIPGDDPGFRGQPNPYHFVLTALTLDRDMFAGLGRMEKEESHNRFQVLFPHASRYGPADILNNISRSLLEGLLLPQVWYQMNAYHLCYLYDSLYNLVEEYSYEDETARREMFPELQGQEINFDGFLNRYFFSTAFLMDQDRFNNLAPEEKNKPAFADPCMFGVINKLIPAANETRLQEIPENPYP